MGTPICEVEQGKLQGQLKNNIDGKPFLEFLGIPYAKPPVGNLRFKAPQSPNNWEGIRDATTKRSCCYSLQILPTPDGINMEPMGSEDCLYLNIFTPKLFTNPEEKLKPVMVFIHGGAFVTGSSDMATTGPEYLMTEDIVLVTLNYRLGVLGFLTIDGVTGNAGLKDMVQALKWIRSNIKQFCGDSNNVTIFGESAGGAAVHYLVLSPLAKGLFHKAIMQSGTVLCPWAHGINNTKELAETLGCAETDDRKLFEYLQEVPVEELVECQTKLGDSLDPATKRKFSPCIEPKSDSAFLCEDPVEVINSGRYNHVPLLLGYNSLEGVLVGWKQFQEFDLTFESLVPYYFGISKSSALYQALNKKIAQFYFGADKIDKSKEEALYTLFTDTMFFIGIYNTIKTHLKTAQHPIYFYRMSLETDLNFFKKMTKTEVKGASHVDDLCYLFKMEGAKLKFGSIEEKSVRRFVKMWTNFARSGSPIPVKDSLLNTDWPPVGRTELNFLDIGVELIAGTDPDGERMAFWDGISSGLKINY